LLESLELESVDDVSEINLPLESLLKGFKTSSYSKRESSGCIGSSIFSTDSIGISIFERKMSLYEFKFSSDGIFSFDKSDKFYSPAFSSKSKT
jgi:hypothetical protein